MFNFHRQALLNSCLRYPRIRWPFLQTTLAFVYRVQFFIGKLLLLMAEDHASGTLNQCVFRPLIIFIIREIDTTSLKPMERRKIPQVAFANVFNRKMVLSPRA